MKIRSIYLTDEFSNWHLNRNILGKVMVLGNRYINVCLKSEPYAKYQELVRNCAMTSSNASKLTLAAGLWGVEIKPQKSSSHFENKNFFF